MQNHVALLPQEVECELINFEFMRAISSLLLLLLLPLLPETDPRVLTRPKTVPECLGAMSTAALGTTPALWKPLAASAKEMSESAAGKELTSPGWMGSDCITSER